MIARLDGSTLRIKGEGSSSQGRYRRDDEPDFEQSFEELSRHVHCVCGVPLDNVDLAEVYERIQAAVVLRTPLLVTTINVNFLINCLRDEEFREAVLASDLCVADGRWVVWLSRFLGVSIKQQITGSDLLEVLGRKVSAEKPLGVYFFGGPPGAAERACLAINARGGGLRGAGFVNPGMVSVEEISRDGSIDAINASGADFLVAALGAKKGQLWLRRNHDRFTIPVRAHLGAVVSFYAGSLKRAPPLLQKLGLEWVWRIKEEPALWQRYGYDGLFLLRLLLSRIPRLVAFAFRAWLARAAHSELILTEKVEFGSRRIAPQGSFTAVNFAKGVGTFRAALAGRENIVVDLSKTKMIDSRMLGLLLLVEKVACKKGMLVTFIGAPSFLKSIIDLFGFTLTRSTDTPAHCDPLLRRAAS